MYSCNSESYATKQNGNATVRMSKPCISESKDTIRNYLPEKSNSKNAAGKIWEEDVATRVFGRTTSSSIKRSSLRSRQNHSSWEKLAKTDDEMHSPSCKTAVNHVSFYRRSKRSAANVRHECDMCQRSFPLVASLKRHAKTHQTRKESSSKVRRRKNHKGKKAKKSRFVFNRGLSTTSIAFAKSSLKDNFHKRDSGSKVRHGASHRLQSATEQMQPDGAKSNCDKLYKTRGKIREVSLSGSTNDVTQNLMTQKKRKEYLPTKVVLERVNYDSSPISIGQKRYGPRQIQGQQDKQERFSHYLEDSNQEESTLPSQTLNKPELQTSSMPKRQVARDTSSNESVVRTQETGKHNISSHECHAFPASFQQECLLQEHINSHDAFESRAKVSTSTDPIHICQHCKMRFTSEESMVTHQHEVHPNQLSTLFVDSGINKGFYSCELCTKPFSSLSCLFNHVSTHQTTIKQHEKRHRCKKCSLSFTLSYTLRKHMEMHHAVTNFFYCVYCCFSTCVRSQYERHTTLHKTLALDVIRPYRSFDFSSLLKYYECCRCSREFFKKSWFEFHMMKCTQPKITLRSCTLCTKWFATQKDLDRHVMTHSDVSKLSTEPNTDLNVLTFPE
ncbi:zinc finger protein Xfin-like [Watersipora subatra]|uniref:zinc finger protein Xfin-like n=1 Tax=Watersipora subatra TaxID=2589382 RepID=UPI00355AE79C